jgi:hypothetical protein
MRGVFAFEEADVESNIWQVIQIFAIAPIAA